MNNRALVCAPLLPEFDRESGSQRIFHTVANLVAGGWAVTFIAENPYGEDRYVAALNQMGVEVHRGFDARTDTVFASGRFDVAIFAFYYLAEAHADRLRTVSPCTRIIVDSIDLHFLRNARRLLQPSAGGAAPVLDDHYGGELVRELSVYAGADAVLTVSQKEADLINDFVGRPGHALAVPDAEERPVSEVPARDRRGVLFVGNFRHPPNLQAAEYLCSEVVPRLDPELLREHPVSLVGNAMPRSLHDLAGRSDGAVRAVGWVPSLDPYLDRARVSVIPLLYGAGTKRKLIQSLMVGIPTVSTSVGAEGLDLRDGQHLVIADDPASMARAITRLLRDDRAWSRLSKAGSARIRRLHGSTEASRLLLRVVDDVVSRSPGRRALGFSTAGDYRRLVEAIRAHVVSVTPVGSTVAVVSKGDGDLVRLPDRFGWHFPGSASGSYAGHYPATGAEAVEHLAELRERGARYLVVPAPYLWWLDHYSELGALLTREARHLGADGVCAVYDLADLTDLAPREQPRDVVAVGR